MPSKGESPAKKLNKTKVVTVKAHERRIYCREYYFICKGCQRDVLRESFGSRPLYCLQCRPAKSKKKADLEQKKLPRPILIELERSEPDNDIGADVGHNVPQTLPDSQNLNSLLAREMLVGLKA